MKIVLKSDVPNTDSVTLILNDKDRIGIFNECGGNQSFIVFIDLVALRNAVDCLWESKERNC